MEFLIAASIAGAGWFASRSSGRAAPPTDAEVGRPESYPFAATPARSGDLLKEQQRASQRRWEASRSASSGIIAAADRPFFRSERTQGTNPAVSQRRMELHTGSLGPGSTSGVWKHKQESGPLFSPQAQPVMSGGSSGNSVSYDPDRQKTALTRVQNNSLPFQQVRVGPGVGIGADVPAADGFHSQYRVLPQDPFAYKHNELQGRTTAGGSLVAAREVDPKVATKGVPRFYAMDRRPLEKGRAAATAPMQHETYGRGNYPGHHVNAGEYFGHAGASGPNVQSGGWVRRKDDDRPGHAVTNVTGERAGIYAHPSYDDSKFQSQQREIFTEYTGTLTGNARRPQSQNTYATQPTNRDVTLSAYVSGAKSYVDAGEGRTSDAPMTTLKETLHDQSNGPAAAVSSVRAASVQCTDRQLLKASKRGSYVANTYVTPPERTDAFARANGASAHQCSGIGKVAVKVRVNESRQLTHGASQSMYSNQALPGDNTTLARNKLPEPNARADFGIARAALQGNELAIDIN